MKKIFLILLISLITVPVILTKPLHATDTRARGIGLLDPAKDRWMLDGILTYVYNNPAYLGVTRNRLFMEYNINNNYVGGLMISATSKIHIGVFSGFEIDSDVFGNGNPYLSLFNIAGASGTYIVGGNNALSAPVSGISDQYFTFMMAFDIRNFSLGFKFGWAGAMDTGENKATGSKYQQSAHAFLMGLGSLIKFRRSTSLEINLDLAIYYIDNFAEDTGTGSKATFQTDGAVDLDLPVRVNYSVNKANTLHFLVGFKYINRSAKGEGASGSGSDTWERVSYDLYFGISDEWRVHQDVLIFQIRILLQT